jgi:hypothetical protein
LPAVPHRRSTRLLLLVLGLALAPLGACGASTEETATTTTEVAAAAGSGFCLTWARYQETLATWLLDPPGSLDEAVASAQTSLRAAEEARSQAPEDLEPALDEVVSAMEAVEDAVARADELPDALTNAAGLFEGTDLTAATSDVAAWLDESC